MSSAVANPLADNFSHNSYSAFTSVLNKAEKQAFLYGRVARYSM